MLKTILEKIIFLGIEFKNLMSFTRPSLSFLLIDLMKGNIICSKRKIVDTVLATEYTKKSILEQGHFSKTIMKAFHFFNKAKPRI